jgi:hypothetical protein
MRTVTILRTLWRQKILVIGVVLVAAVAAILVGYKVSFPPKLESRKYDVGVASARIFVDTPASQVVDVAPKGSDTLGVRANLLANLMVDGEVKTVIARRAGLRTDQLYGMSDTVTGPPTPTATPSKRGWMLRTHVVSATDGSWLPIIEVQTQAPNAAAAARLADAAVGGLREYLDSKAAGERVNNASRLRISGLGVAQARNEARGPRMLYSLAAFLVLVGLGFAAIIAGTSLIRDFRKSTTPDPVDAEALSPDEADLDADDSPHFGAWPARLSGPQPVSSDDASLRERAS